MCVWLTSTSCNRRYINKNTIMLKNLIQNPKVNQSFLEHWYLTNDINSENRNRFGLCVLNID